MSQQDILNLFESKIPETAYSEPNKVMSYSEVSSNSSFEVQSWLPFISKKYNISANIKDYFFIPVIILPTDLPNRKNVAFPLSSVTEFLTYRGMPAYKTWKGMPVQIDHINTDPTKGIGVVIDTELVKFENSSEDFYKVMALLAIDRTKNPDIARAIEIGKRKYFSMGALIGSYECSICGMRSKPKSIDTDCGHVSRNKVNLYRQKDGSLKVGHYLAHDINGFEISTVAFPAWASAETLGIIDIGV